MEELIIYKVIVVGDAKDNYPEPIAYFSSEDKAKEFIKTAKGQFYSTGDVSTFHDYRFLELEYIASPLDTFKKLTPKLDLMHMEVIGDKSVYTVAKSMSVYKDDVTKNPHNDIVHTFKELLTGFENLDYCRKKINQKGGMGIRLTLSNVSLLGRYIEKLLKVTEPLRLENQRQNTEDLMLMLSDIEKVLDNEADMTRKFVEDILKLDTNELLQRNNHMYLEFEPITVGYYKAMENALNAFYVLSMLKRQLFQSFVVWDREDDTYTFFYSELQVNNFLKSKLNGSTALEVMDEVIRRYNIMHYSDSEMAKVSGISIDTLKTLGYVYRDFKIELDEDGRKETVSYKMYQGSYTPDIKFDVHVGLELEKGRQ